jgi:hypothetical protein
VEEWLEREIGVKVNVKEAFKINKDKMLLAKIEIWEEKKNIKLNKSKLKKKKDKRMYECMDDDLTKVERETQKKLRELANVSVIKFVYLDILYTGCPYEKFRAETKLRRNSLNKQVYLNSFRRSLLYRLQIFFLNT